ncbi:hypothetical protein EW146_g3363 [Bondarzewia mesenterica]|uniref:Uncharacterized protein n=1 Tax=Bondarzewia mesenterica TaxID=1095465 RepID=A0A4S4LY22_9AGAM|nr:hypothetical protein EW146_g3363 [Bondarzewia mesenterica]
MEFLPPEGAARGKGKGKENYTRVRLAWYYRPSDVSDRPVADSRLLLAAIYSEICDIAQLRSKCFVVHRDKITDLAGWKKRPDRFYFNRLFDPYIKKEFEVIRSDDVRNLPPHIREVLTSRYEYVVAEKEIVPDLTDTLRNCDTCAKWCPPPESVRCDRCKRFFHMTCVQPPLIAKPSRGYGWTCAPCSRAHEKEVAGHQVRHPTPNSKPKSNAPPARGRGRPRKDRSLAEKEESVEVKHFKMWPFRYFGLYTVAEDTLDPDDLIFPRTATRMGPKYQAVIPPLGSLRDPELDERGGDATIEILSVVHKMSDADVENRKARLTARQEVCSSVDWLTEVTKRFSDAWLAKRDFSTVNMADPFRHEKWKKTETRYTDREWDEDEKTAFEDAIAAHGAELRPVRDEVGTRTISEVVRYYGHWKNGKLGEENEHIRYAKVNGEPLPVPAPEPSGIDSDEEGSIVKQPTKANASCGACRTRESKIWWKAPKGLPTNVLCDNCGLSWRKYADLNHVRPMREESVAAKNKAAEKREGTPLNGPTAKRAKMATGSAPSSPQPSVSSALHPQCLACKKSVGKVLKCQQCQTRVHAGACGVVLEPGTDSWTCDICNNAKVAEASLNTECLLCPRPRRNRKSKDPYPSPDTFLRACKPTEGQGWAHVLCSVFIPEVTFSDASRLRLVEGITVIPQSRWIAKCSICHQTGGAVIRCSDCTREFHVSCAWDHGYKFGFDVQPIKNRKDATATVTFNASVGSMHAVVRCKDHESGKRSLYDICDTNELGQVSAAPSLSETTTDIVSSHPVQTALQVYCKTYKQAQTAQSHALLRKAQRLDDILRDRDASMNGMNGVNGAASHVAPEPQCLKCKTTYSPFFHRVPDYYFQHMKGDPEGSFLCHRCHDKDMPGVGRRPAS